MSLNEILGTAVSGLAASQAGLRSVSNNIANVNTPGYAREKTAITSNAYGGVSIGEPTRVADRFLEETVYRRAGDTGQADVQANYTSRLQALLGTPGDASGLPGRIDAISAAAIDLTGTAGATQKKAVFVAAVQDAIGGLKQTQADTQALASDVAGDLSASVDRANVLLKQIYTLNGTVSQAQGQGRSTAAASDQRNSAIEELSGLMKVTVRNQSDGRVTIETSNGTALLDDRLRQLSYPVGDQAAAQSSYPAITLRFADGDLAAGASTGEKIDTGTIGGKIGGLVALRDQTLPAFQEKLGALFTGLAGTLNAASNAATTVPAPNSLEGHATGLTAGDRLGFTGAATFAVTDASGKLVAKTSLDFSTMSANATVGDALSAINAGLNGAATASLDATGTLTFTAAASGNGVVVAQGTPASDRGGAGFSQYFGLNDVVRSDTSPLVPTGFTAGDASGFATGQTAEIDLRDGNGRMLAAHVLTPATGGTVGDLVTELNGSDLGQYGSFALAANGRFQFTPKASVGGAAISIPSDSTDRLGTGVSFTALSGLTGAADALTNGAVRVDLAGDTRKLPVATFDASAGIGRQALGTGDTSGATGLVNALAGTTDFGTGGKAALDTYAANLVSSAGIDANQAASRLSVASASQTDAINRRDNFSGVNLDEELSQMVVLQNSYSAAARVISTASQMYDTLLNMIK
ncbi:flagellar hook-associated protein FlgK [Sphingomonas sp. BAUL-RG-20F-R05-02]|uniref:flagellar hook-associated protein FlgK n=1 Tax=Sphingomonas sp. BAUL-RG-20F-R05-02 TaxID=2914830 RepID=UPI001F59A390|nr:flagellar basal body rod C-terminal domain-containing protein [Sphingomonas sp. BAUL-RG-20F-R05-02]